MSHWSHLLKVINRLYFLSHIQFGINHGSYAFETFIQELDALNANSEFPMTEKYMAKYEFAGSTDIELQFKKGSIVMVIEKADNGWWKGICEGLVGWFPETYVRPVPKEAKKREQPEEVPRDRDVEQPRGMDEMMASGECHVTLSTSCLAASLSINIQTLDITNKDFMLVSSSQDSILSCQPMVSLLQTKSVIVLIS